MKVTPGNVARFWVRLMFPPGPENHLRQRLKLQGDPPWEPWLHCAVWISVFAVIGAHYAAGQSLDRLDWIWVALGVISPPVGFFSVWILANSESCGRARYVAMWMRLCADAGVVLTIAVYQIVRVGEGGRLYPLMANIVLAFCAWYMATLVARDIHLVRTVEKLAESLYREDGEAVLAWKLNNILGEDEEGRR